MGKLKRIKVEFYFAVTPFRWQMVRFQPPRGFGLLQLWAGPFWVALSW